VWVEYDSKEKKRDIMSCRRKRKTLVGLIKPGKKPRRDFVRWNISSTKNKLLDCD